MSNFGILHTVYEQENGRIYNEILENEFINEYLVIEFEVGNNWIYTESHFTNDIDEEDFSDQSVVYRVGELAQIPHLDKIVEGDM